MMIEKGVISMSRSYVNAEGKRYFGAAADAHHTKEMGYSSAEEYADASFDAGYDAGYQERKREELEKWKSNRESEIRRSKIKVS